MTKLVKSYYPSDNDLLADPELQAFIAEAIPAQIIDFPSAPLTSRKILIDILLHLAFLTSTVHHTLNTNDLVESSATLPFHAASLYAPIPLSKGISDAELLTFLPPAEAAIGQIALTAFFARPMIAGTNQTLARMWDDPVLLERLNDESNSAAQEFRHAMNKFSRIVHERKFDKDGLSQGMPFVWRALDPEVAPFYLAI
jgi:arachidonate 15-lipoxygenase (second type) / 8-lipoxygenase (S-type)